MNPTDVVKATDYASQQSDRWLFIALLVVFLLAIGALARWGMRQLELRDARIDKLQNDNSEARREQSALTLSHAERFATLVSQNTEALERNTAAFDRIVAELPKKP